MKAVGLAGQEAGFPVEGGILQGRVLKAGREDGFGEQGGDAAAGEAVDAGEHAAEGDGVVGPVGEGEDPVVGTDTGIEVGVG